MHSAAGGAALAGREVCLSLIFYAIEPSLCIVISFLGQFLGLVNTRAQLAYLHCSFLCASRLLNP